MLFIETVSFIKLNVIEVVKEKNGKNWNIQHKHLCRARYSIFCQKIMWDRCM